MCVAAAPAQFSETILYHGQCRHPEHGDVHVLGYQNVAANQAPSPNAMLVHLPGTGMTQANFVDTSGARHMLTDMAAARWNAWGPAASLSPRRPSRSTRRPRTRCSRLRAGGGGGRSAAEARLTQWRL